MYNVHISETIVFVCISFAKVYFMQENPEIQLTRSF